MDVEWDPAKGRSNFKKHGVSFADSEVVLYDPFGITLRDPDAAGEERYVTLGRDSLDHILVVIYTFRGEKARLISARRATKSERRMYEERIRFQ